MRRKRGEEEEQKEEGKEYLVGTSLNHWQQQRWERWERWERGVGVMTSRSELFHPAAAIFISHPKPPKIQCLHKFTATPLVQHTTGTYALGDMCVYVVCVRVCELKMNNNRQ